MATVAVERVVAVRLAVAVRCHRREATAAAAVAEATGEMVDGPPAKLQAWPLGRRWPG